MPVVISTSSRAGFASGVALGYGAFGTVMKTIQP